MQQMQVPSNSPFSSATGRTTWPTQSRAAGPLRPACAPGESSMSMRMLIDARHPEETRVAVAKGNRIEEFDFESSEHKQLKGNIYLAKVTRVEPSLQAAFVDYGGNRHGFLAFSEIHPDYYQIPVADRQALIDADARAARESEDEDEQPHRGGRRRRGRHRGRESRHDSRHDEAVHSENLV